MRGDRGLTEEFLRTRMAFDLVDRPTNSGTDAVDVSVGDSSIAQPEIRLEDGQKLSDCSKGGTGQDHVRTTSSPLSPCIVAMVVWWTMVLASAHGPRSSYHKS